MVQNDKVALVTGSSRGIGRAIASQLAREGYAVCVNYYERKDKADELVTQLTREGCRAIAVQADVARRAEVDAMLKTINDTFGPVSLLVNNAGSAYYGLHEELSPKKIQEMVRTDLEVPMILSQQLLRGFKKNKGCIVNIASVTAQQSNPHGCAYGAVKAGLVSFSRSLFDEARKYGVRVATVSPDMTKTELYRNADFTVGEETESYLLPQDVAEAVAYIVGQREGVAVSEVTLRPQYHRIRRKPVAKKERPVE